MTTDTISGISQHDRDRLIEAANRRSALHQNRIPQNAAIIDDYEIVGLAGEWAFGALFGVEPDLSDMPKGDGHVDFWVWCKTPIGDRMFTVDVKTAKTPGHLIATVTSLRNGDGADIFVLAEYLGNCEARLLGWEHRSALVGGEIKRLRDDGPLNHTIKRRDLRPMPDLIGRILRCEARRTRT